MTWRAQTRRYATFAFLESHGNKIAPLVSRLSSQDDYPEKGAQATDGTVAGHDQQRGVEPLASHALQIGVEPLASHALQRRIPARPEDPDFARRSCNRIHSVHLTPG